MGILFAIIGIILTIFTAFNLIRSIEVKKKSIIKKAKVIGFESYTYFMPGAEYHAVYNASIYPILEVEEDNKKVRVAISYLNEKFNLEKGDELEVIYPKGKVEKLKIYSNEEIYNFYYLTIIIGIVITLLSMTII
ncbi:MULTISPECIES: hypothetical protein [Clostridium]|uniref:hypothetical protein n=1 Tax=Clostridium TaxID=1485 RepID=UPI0018997B6A|nr:MULTISPECIES: hypothetical protein [Clostridium]MCR1951431.1 hypothetical protein [Clostridium sp. DSM 100503]MDI9215210.1 hypothetical protein [Clostridium tertium]